MMDILPNEARTFHFHNNRRVSPRVCDFHQPALRMVIIRRHSEIVAKVSTRPLLLSVHWGTARAWIVSGAKQNSYGYLVHFQQNG